MELNTTIEFTNGQWNLKITKLSPIQLIELINSNKLKVENKEMLAPHWRLLLK